MHIYLGKEPGEEWEIAGSPFRLVVYDIVTPSHSYATLSVVQDEKGATTPGEDKADPDRRKFTVVVGDTLKLLVQGRDTNNNNVGAGGMVFVAQFCLPEKTKNPSEDQKGEEEDTDGDEGEDTTETRGSFNINQADSTKISLNLGQELVGSRMILGGNGELQDHKDGTYSKQFKLSRTGQFWLKVEALSVEHSLWWYSSTKNKPTGNGYQIQNSPLIITAVAGKLRPNHST